MKFLLQACLVFIIVSSFLSPAFAMLPEPGLYEKRNASGRLEAELSIFRPEGVSYYDGRNMANIEYLYFRRFSSDGKCMEEEATSYDWKTDVAGSGWGKIRIKGKDCVSCYEGHMFYSEPVTIENSRDAFTFAEKDIADVSIHENRFLSGRYKKVKGTPHMGPALMIYAYEKKFAGDFTSERKPSIYSYRKHSFADIHVAEKMEGKIRKGIIFDGGFNIVLMDNMRSEYFPLFVSYGFSKSAFLGRASSDPLLNSVYMYNWLLRKNYVCLPDICAPYVKMTDFYSGEGENAITTCAYEVRFNLSDGSRVVVAKGDVTDSREIRGESFSGRYSIDGDGAALMAVPKSDGRIIMKLQNGTDIDCFGYVLSDGASGWRYCRAGNGSGGFISSKFLRLKK